jgi:uncharacterized protein Yka (UPF0111/DUF47 family)
MSALRHNDTGTAGKWLKLYEEQSGFVNENFLAQKGHESYYALKGNYLLQCGEITTAEIFFRRLMTSAHQPEMSLRAYQGLYETFSRGGQRDSTAKYAVLYSQYNDSSTMALRSRELQQLESLYNYSRQQQIAEKNRQEARNWMIAVIGTVMAAMLMVSILLLAFYRFKTRRLQEVSYLKEKKEYLEQLMIKKDASAEEIRREIVRLNNKNASNSKMYKETINRLQTQICTLQQKLLETLQTAEADPSAEHIVILFKQKLQDYHSGDNPPTESEWEQLKKSFSVNHRSGYQLVTSSYNLTEEQIRVCLMTMLDISESMMAFALNTDRKRIDRVKRQANKKLFGEDNASALKSNLRLYYP